MRPGFSARAKKPYPELRRFLAFWAEQIDGPLHSVRVGRSELLTAPTVTPTAGIWRLH